MQTQMSAFDDWGLIMADNIATCLPNGNESYDLKHILDGLDDLETEVQQVPVVEEEEEECKKIVHGRGKEITRVKRMIQSPKKVVHGRGKEMAHVKRVYQSPKKIVHGRGKEITHVKRICQSPESVQEANSEGSASAPALKMTHESYQAKLEATKRKLHQGYQGCVEGRKKTKILDLKDIPLPFATPCRDIRRRAVNSRRCYKQFPKTNRVILGI